MRMRRGLTRSGFTLSIEQKHLVARMMMVRILMRRMMMVRRIMRMRRETARMARSGFTLWMCGWDTAALGGCSQGDTWPTPIHCM